MKDRCYKSVCGLTHGQVCVISSFLSSTEVFEVGTFLNLGEYDYVVGDPCSVVIALVGGVLWRVCHHEPYSPVAGGRRGRSST